MSEQAEESQETNKSLSEPQGKEYISSGPPERSESVVSLRSDHSLVEHPNFKDEDPPSQHSSSGPPERSESVVSLQSDHSLVEHPNFKDEDIASQHRLAVPAERSKSAVLRSDHSIKTVRPNIKDENPPSQCSDLQDHLHTLTIQPKEERRITETAEIGDRGNESSPAVEALEKIKSNLKLKFLCLNEGPANEFSQTPLSKIFTDLYITDSGSDDITTEHEFRQIEVMSRFPTTDDMEIQCNDIFKPSPEQDRPIRTVLTKGIAGIGKTVSVQKFILDWTEGEANSDVHLILPLPFRELNLLKDEELSLMDLLGRFFTDTKEVDISSSNYKIIFIFDGLDECRLPLDFQKNENLSDVTKSASVDVLLTNLITRNLLPSSLIWITSRPASAHQIPSVYINRVTEVRGFRDSQKEEYFRKKISDQAVASKVNDHIKSAKALHVMCHIPVFCWISATVLERTIEEEEIPKTLTQMYTHFLVFQTKQKMSEDLLLKLGKLAFDQLMKHNLIFYEEDLNECGIDVSEASMLLGVCTKFFKEEVGLYQKKVYYFVHLSVQEHLAALYVHLTFMRDNRNILEQSWLPAWLTWRKLTLSDLHRCAVDMTLKDKNGHLDLFLRFFLGLSLESGLLRGILTQTGSGVYNTEEIATYIKKKIQGNLPAEKSINLFHCLNELNDRSLIQEVQNYLNSGEIKQTTLSSSQWSAVVFVLLMSLTELDKFDLSTYTGAHNRSEEQVLLRLLPVIKASRSAQLNTCNLTNRSCAALALVISSGTSLLRELNLSWNDLLDSGVKQLSSGLGNPYCKLEKLKLAHCGLESEACRALASALLSNPFHLMELDLTKNDLGDDGVKQLSAGLRNPQCRLKALELVQCEVKDEGCAALASALKSNPSALKKLDLSENREVGDSGVKQLATALESPLCTLEMLRLWGCGITEEGCAILASVLRSNPSHLRELDLTRNNILDSGLKLLSAELENHQCKIEILRLRYCGFTDEGCSALVSALKSNPFHLIELNMSGNKIDTGLKELNALKDDSQYSLQKLTFCK